MPKFKPLICGLLTLPLTACLDSSEEMFFSTKLSEKNSKIEFLDIHQLNLVIGTLVNEIDESDFSPILKSHFTLKDLSNGPWPNGTALSLTAICACVLSLLWWMAFFQYPSLGYVPWHHQQ
jgi:hypothetical protein